MDHEVRSDAERLVQTAHDRQVTQMKLVLDDGSEVDVPTSLTRFVAGVLESIAQGHALGTRSVPEELTTTVAADLLGISRPTLMRLIADEAVPAFKVGTHTRLKREDVLALKHRREVARAAAVDALLAAGEAFD